MGPVNSAPVHCSPENCQKLWLEKKKKKRGRKREIENIDTHKSYPNTHLEAKNSGFL